MARIHQIRQKIIDRAYYLSSHAEDEMINDELERDDIEHAILKGRIQKRLSEDIRGQDIGLKVHQTTEGKFMLFADLKRMATSL